MFTVLLKKNVTYIFDGLRVTAHFHLFNISFLWTLCFTAGQFYHGVNFEVSDLFPGKDPDKQDANMFVKGNKLTVTRWMKTNIKCIVEFTLQERQKINSVFHSIPHESRGWQREFQTGCEERRKCALLVYSQYGNGLLDGVHTDYIVSESLQNNIDICHSTDLCTTHKVHVSFHVALSTVYKMWWVYLDIMRNLTNLLLIVVFFLHIYWHSVTTK